MYYFYPAHYYQPPLGHIAYHPVPTSPLVDSRSLYQNQQVINTPNQYNYPPANTDLLTESAKESRKLMAEASKVLEMFATSKEFSSKIMNAAQRSDHEEVKRIIHSIGITSDVKIDYNPDGLRLEFNSKVSNAECCRLLISLRWR